MRARPVLALAAVFLAIVFAVPAPLAPTRVAIASHAGGAACSPGPDPSSDGVVSPGEYGETYFDGITKILAYFHCDDRQDRLLHAALVTPWSGWVGLLVQATEPMDGYANEVRLAYTPAQPGVQILDAYRNISESQAISDLVYGGRGDVTNVSTGTAGAARVYEFTIPLRSSDPYDSWLDSEGPFYFAFEYNADMVDLDSEATALSSGTFVVESVTSTGLWSTMELSVVTPAAAPEPATMFLTLRDAAGYPVPSAQVEIFVRTAFGFLEVGPAYTNEQGVATATYAPRDKGDFVLGAAYTGGYGLLASVAWQILHVAFGPAEDGSATALGPGGLAELKSVEALVVVIVLGVWATYGYALTTTLGSMRRPRAGSPAMDPPGMTGRREE